MKRYFLFVSFLFLFCFIVPSSIVAQSMSELNVKAFKETRETVANGEDSVKNPFAAEKASPQTLSAEDLYLTGVAVSSGKSYALINGYILSEGEKIAGLTIKSITREKVILQALDTVHTLYFGGGL